MNTLTTNELQDLGLSGVDVKSKDVIIESTRRTPFVHYNFGNKTLLITGSSTEVDMHHFYFPIISRLKQDMKGHDSFQLHVCLEDLNSSSAKIFFDLFRYLHLQRLAGKTLEIIWEAIDEDIFEVGKDFADFIEMDISLVYQVTA